MDDTRTPCRLAAAVESYLASHGVSQEQLASEIGVSQHTVSRFFAGERTHLNTVNTIRLVGWLLEVKE